MTIHPASISTYPSSTMLAGLYGHLQLDEPRSTKRTHDLFSLFVARSSMMGWLTEAGENAMPRRWAMNDAGDSVGSSAHDARLVSWFQVTPIHGTAPHSRSPIQPLLACAVETTERTGTFRLDKASILVPLDQNRATPWVLGELAEQAAWFADLTPNRMATIEIQIVCPSTATKTARAIPGWLNREFFQDVIRINPRLTTEQLSVQVEYPFAQHMPEDVLSAVSLHATLVEWSDSAVGWVQELISHSLRHQGMTSTALISVIRH